MDRKYEEVKGRLPSTALVENFIGKFLDDKYFETLCDEMKNGNKKGFSDLPYAEGRVRKFELYRSFPLD